MRCLKCEYPKVDYIHRSSLFPGWHLWSPVEGPEPEPRHEPRDPWCGTTAPEPTCGGMTPPEPEE